MSSIQTIDNFLTNNEIDIINDYVKDKNLETGSVESKGINNSRRSQIFWLPKNDNFNWLYDKLEILVNLSYDKKLYCDEIQYTEYSYKYKGHYNWHKDSYENSKTEDVRNRKISISIQLSDSFNYDGGVLDIQDEETGQIKAMKRKKGTMIMFPSNFLHKVEPVTFGVRKSIVVWFFTND